MSAEPSERVEKEAQNETMRAEQRGSSTEGAASASRIIRSVGAAHHLRTAAVPSRPVQEKPAPMNNLNW